MIIDKKGINKTFNEKTVNLIDSFNKNANENAKKYLSTDVLCKSFYNLTSSNNKLTDNSGFAELVLPTQQNNSNVYQKKLTYSNGITLKKVWRYKYYSQNNSRYEYMLLAYASDKKIYFNNIFSYGVYLSAMGSFTFNETPTLVSFRLNGYDCIGFATTTNDFVVWNCDANPYAVNTCPKFRSICLKDGKMFAIEDGANYAVRYSSTVDPTQWTSNDDANGGRIDLNDFRGELRKIVSHLDNLYVFRDFGISKISKAGSTYIASNIFNSSTKIYSSTICTCNEDICFLCEDGLYKFDGYKVGKINLSIFENFKKYLQNGAQTCFYNNLLYISCYLNFSSTEPQTIENNSVIVVDLNAEKFSVIYGTNVCSFYAFKDLNASKLIACLGGTNAGKLWELTSGTSSELTLDKFWESSQFVVTNETEIKALKKIFIKTKSNLTLSISSDNKTKTFSVLGSNSNQVLKLNLRGKIFKVSFVSTAKQFEIDYFKLVFAVKGF